MDRVCFSSTTCINIYKVNSILCMKWFYAVHVCLESSSDFDLICLVQRSTLCVMLLICDLWNACKVKMSILPRPHSHITFSKFSFSQACYESWGKQYIAVADPKGGSRGCNRLTWIFTLYLASELFRSHSVRKNLEFAWIFGNDLFKSYWSLLWTEKSVILGKICYDVS